MKIPKLIIVVIISLLWCIKSSCQTKSFLYNDRGRLIADKTYKISKRQLRKFISVESDFKEYLKKHIQSVITVVKDGFHAGYVIVSFKIGATDTLQQIKIEKDVEKRDYLSREVLRVLKQMKIPQLIYSKGLSNKKYFIAIDINPVKPHNPPGFIEIQEGIIPNSLTHE
jgi:hypothetical protein